MFISLRMWCFSHDQPFPIAFFGLSISSPVRSLFYFQEGVRYSLWEQTLFMLLVGGPSDGEHAHSPLKWFCIPASQWILCRNYSWKWPDEEIYKYDKGIYKYNHKSLQWNPFQSNLLHLCSHVLSSLCNHFAIISSLNTLNERDSFYFEHLSQISMNLISHHFPQSWHCKAIPLGLSDNVV